MVISERLTEKFLRHSKNPPLSGFNNPKESRVQSYLSNKIMQILSLTQVLPANSENRTPPLRIFPIRIAA
jgi:hypothetical protein